MKGKKIRIGGGSAYERDPIEGAVVLVERGKLNYIGLDTLAERTLALAQLRRREDPTKGYNPLLESRVRSLLPLCVKNKTKIITNAGAANPQAATNKVIEIANESGYKGLKVATILGDDVRDIIGKVKLTNIETGTPLEIRGEEVMSANAYIGAEPIVEALEGGADVVVGGRIGDLALFLAPLIYEFGWGAEDWNKKAAGSVVAHLIECSCASTGGYLAFPGYVEVPGLDNLGYPLAEVDEDGEAVITKPERTGGIVTELSLTAHLVYEIHDPANYLTPDVVVDVRDVKLQQVGKDRVRISGAKGKGRPKDLKVLIGVRRGYVAESEVSYAGWGAYEKAKLAIDKMIKPHLKKMGNELDETRIDIIGVDSVHGQVSPEPKVAPYEVRVRVAAKTKSSKSAEEFCDRMITDGFMSTVGAGGPRRSINPLLALYPTLIPRELISTKVTIEEVK